MWGAPSRVLAGCKSPLVDISLLPAEMFSRQRSILEVLASWQLYADGVTKLLCCLQIRARLLLLPVAAQCLSAACLMSCVTGAVMQDVVKRFGSTMLLAAVCSCGFELRSRRAFLLQASLMQT
jgi:hypothetical protein